MEKRQTINIPNSGRNTRGETHRAPIPDGAKVGQIVCSSLLAGRDPELNAVPEDPELQAQALFRNIRSFMEEVGGTPDNIAQMTVYLRNEDYRSYVNTQWLEMYPDANNRPARIITYRDPEGGGPTAMLVSLIAMV